MLDKILNYTEGILDYKSETISTLESIQNDLDKVVLERKKYVTDYAAKVLHKRF